MPNPKKVLESAKRAEVKLRALARAKVRVHAAAVRRLQKAREQAERAAMRGSRKAITRERRLVTADFQAFKTATPTEKARVKRTIESQIGRLRKIEKSAGLYLPFHTTEKTKSIYGSATLAALDEKSAKLALKQVGKYPEHRAHYEWEADAYQQAARRQRALALPREAPKARQTSPKKKGGPKKPPSPAQLAARAKFVAMVRAKAAGKK